MRPQLGKGVGQIRADGGLREKGWNTVGGRGKYMQKGRNHHSPGFKICLFNLRLKCRKKEKGGKRRQGEIRLRLECVPVPWEALEDCKQKSENLSLL